MTNYKKYNKGDLVKIEFNDGLFTKCNCFCSIDRLNITTNGYHVLVINKNNCTMNHVEGWTTEGYWPHAYIKDMRYIMPFNQELEELING